MSAVGISFGSTYCSVGVFRSGRFTIIPDEHGSPRIPSYVAFAGTECLVGMRAKDCEGRNPLQIVSGIKRLLGRSYDDAENLRVFPYKIVNYCGRPKIPMERNGKSKLHTPEEIAAMLLGKLKEMAEKYLGEKVLEVVIAVPAAFNRFQRQATKEACEIAGLNVKRIVSESTAAVLAFDIHAMASATSTVKDIRNIIAFDFGGAGCSVSIVCVEDGIFEVLSTAGDIRLGGEDVNHLLVSHFVEEFRQKHQMDLRCCASAMQRLWTACEHAKRTLSHSEEAVVELESLMQGNDLRGTISRLQFEHLCSDLFRRALALVKRALDDTRILKKEDIDEIVLAGGSTHIPQMQTLLTEYFGGKMLNRSLNPNEATVYGAAVQAAILSGSKDPVLQTVLLMDTLPFSLGIETADGTLAVAIKRNCTLPTKQTIYCTTKDHEQSAVTIKVYEGEDALAKDNLLLRRFDHFGIAPAPRGVPRIAVTFDIGADGEMDVSAEDNSSDRDSVSSDYPVYSLAYLQ